MASERLVLPSLSDAFVISNCGSGPENCHGIAFVLVSGATFGCVLHQLLSPTRWNGSPGQVRPETVWKGPGAQFGWKTAENLIL